MEELERLHEVALNIGNRTSRKNTFVVSLNIRSISSNFKNFKSDKEVRAKVIALQETWCVDSQDVNQFKLLGYDMHFVSHGRGRGLATYFLPEFHLTGEINSPKYQMCKVSCKNFDVVNIYRSQGAVSKDFISDLGKLAAGKKPCFLVGDFNINFLEESHHPIIKKILSCGFRQIVDSPTHSAGGLLDHAYVKNIPFEPKAAINFPFYSDHAHVSIIKPSI